MPSWRNHEARVAWFAANYSPGSSTVLSHEAVYDDLQRRFAQTVEWMLFEHFFRDAFGVEAFARHQTLPPAASAADAEIDPANAEMTGRHDRCEGAILQLTKTRCQTTRSPLL